MKIVISSGHGAKVQGAVGILNEHAEAVRVVDEVAKQLKALGVDVVTFEDKTSTSQNQNLETIVDFHNGQGAHDLDVSVHFNAYTETSSPMGTECLFVTQADLADVVSEAMAEAGGFIDRGPKKRTDLYFLNQTNEASILVETCFVDSSADASLYKENFTAICRSLAETISGKQIPVEPQKPERPSIVTPTNVLFKTSGTVSWFGGPNDTTGVAADEGLAFFYEYDDAPHLFLDAQPPSTTGLARRLNPERPYVACRWNYDVTPKDMLREMYPALIRAPSTGKIMLCWPADWGPHEEKTGRAADVAPSVLDRLGIKTDDVVDVVYPAPLNLIAWQQHKKNFV